MNKYPGQVRYTNVQVWNSSIECHVARLLVSPQENCQQKSTDNLQNTMSKKNEPKNKDG